MTTAEQALHAAVTQFRAAGVESPQLDAKVLLLHALKTSREALARDPHRSLQETEIALFESAVRRRAAREPISQITGRREFWSLPFGITGDTLIPRPDSEVLVELACCHAPRRACLSILDLGTGSGCLLIALLREFSEAWGLGVDISAPALRVARKNAQALGVARRCSFLQADWAASLAGHFDIVVTNPPYIRSTEIPFLAPEVARYEPQRALDGGLDGCDAYRRLAPQLACLLKADGVAVVEVGDRQAAPVAGLMAEVGMSNVAIGSDLGGVARCLVLSAPGSKKNLESRD